MDATRGCQDCRRLARRKVQGYPGAIMRPSSLGVFAVLFVVVGSGCASSAAVAAAKRGDDVAMKAAILEKHKAGKLGDAEAADIARAVVSRELQKASGEAAVDRVHDVRSCVPAVAAALEDRAKIHDDAGAEAALALFEGHELSISRAKNYVHDASDPWRAVGARALGSEDDRDARLAALVDPSARVRRSAARAAADAKDEHDLDALFETARVDPEPFVRSEAVRAIAQIDAGGLVTVNRLRDLWSASDDPLREDIAIAYASPNLAAAGGRDAVRTLVASGHGPGVIAAAAAVLRPRKEGLFDAETKKSAVALLVRTIDDGSRRDRLFGIAVARLDEADLASAIARASTCEDDLDVRLSAYVRLLETPKTRDAAMKELLAFAGPDVKGPIGRRARLALADAGDLRIQAWIEADLVADDPSGRLSAVQALSALHRPARGAPLLADDDPRVRTRAACTILSATR
ncbi:hypothetical protein BH09MYX1_BH09MYX1_17110 [soil metagenome]